MKQFESRFRFFFMTGVMKFTGAGIFPSFNNQIDISSMPEYGTLLGFAEEAPR